MEQGDRYMKAGSDTFYKFIVGALALVLAALIVSKQAARSPSGPGAGGEGPRTNVGYSEGYLNERLAALDSKKTLDTLCAIRDLGLIGGQATAAVPKLVTLIGENDQINFLLAVEGETDRVASNPERFEGVSMTSVSHNAVTALDRIDPSWRSGRAAAEARKAFEEKLKEHDYKVRIEGAWALREIGDSASVSLLYPLLRDPDEGVRFNAKLALDRIRPGWNLENQPQVKSPAAQASSGETSEIAASAPAAFSSLEIAITGFSRSDIALASGTLKYPEAFLTAFGKLALPARFSLSAGLGAAVYESVSSWIAGARERRLKAIALGGIKTGAARDELLSMLEDPCFLVRAEAAYQLGESGHTGAVGKLILLLSDRGERVADNALEALDKIDPAWRGDPACDSASVGLRANLASPDTSLRRNSVFLIGTMGRKDMAPDLRRALRDPDADVRREAVTALGLAGEPSDVRTLAGAIAPENFALMEYAFGSIEKLDPAWMDSAYTSEIFAAAEGALSSPEPETARFAFSKMSLIRSEATIKKFKSLIDSDNAVTSAFAVSALASVAGAAAAGEMIAALSDRREPVSTAAVEALASIGGPGVSSALVGMMKTGTPGQMAKASLALDGIDPMWRFSTEAVAVASDMAVKLVSGNTSEILAATGSLGFLKHPGAAEKIFENTATRETALAIASFAALLNIDETAAAFALEKNIVASTQETGIGCMKSLESFKPGSDSQLSLLLTLLRHYDKGVRMNVDQTLYRAVPGWNVSPVVDERRKKYEELYESETGEARVAVFDALAYMRSPRSLPLIAAGLGDRAPAVRAIAARAIGRLGDRQSVPMIVSLLGDEDNSVRTAAEIALGEISGETVEAALLAVCLSDDDTVSSSARSVLELTRRDWREAPGARAQAARLVALAKTGDPAAKLAAFSKLGKFGYTDEDGLLDDLLYDEDAAVREEAARWMLSSSDDNVPAVVHMMRDPKFAFTEGYHDLLWSRQGGWRGGSEAVGLVKTLVECVADDDADMSIRASNKLSRFLWMCADDLERAGCEKLVAEAAEAVASLLCSKDATVREAGKVILLNNMAWRGALPFKLMESADPFARGVGLAMFEKNGASGEYGLNEDHKMIFYFSRENVDGLERIGPRASIFLERLLTGGNAKTALRAAVVLFRFAPEKWLPRLVEATKSCADPYERARALEKITEIRKQYCIPILAAFVADPEKNVREYAIKGICSFRPDAIGDTDTVCLMIKELTRDKYHSYYGSDPLEVLVKIGDRALPHLTAALASHSGATDEAALKARVFEAVRRIAENDLRKISRICGIDPDRKEKLNVSYDRTRPRYPESHMIDVPGNFEELTEGQKILKKIGEAFSDTSPVLIVEYLISEESKGCIRRATEIARFSPKASPALRELLKEPKNPARIDAVKILSYLNDTESVPLIRGMMAAGNTEEVLACAIYVRRFKPASPVPELAAAAGHGDERVRNAAIWSLFETDKKQALKPALAALKKFPDARSQNSVLEIVYGRDRAAGLKAALEIFDSDPSGFRPAVYQIMLNEKEPPRKFDPIKIFVENDVKYPLESALLERIAKMKKDDVAAGIRKALAAADHKVRLRALELIRYLNFTTLFADELAKSLGDANYRVRSDAAGLIAIDGAVRPQFEKKLPYILAYHFVNDKKIYKMFGGEIIPDLKLNLGAIIEKIKSYDASVKAGKKPEELEFFGERQAAYSSADKSMRYCAELGATECVGLISFFLTGGEYYTRQAAAETLGVIGAKEAAGGLVKALDDGSREVVLTAIESLGKVGSEAAIPKIIPFLWDDEGKKAGGKGITVTVTYGGDGRWRSAHPANMTNMHAYRALAAFGKKAVPDLLNLITAEVPVTARSYAAQLLGDAGWEPKTTREIIAFYSAREQYEMLAGTGPEGAKVVLAALEGGAGSLDRSAACIRALGELRCTEAVEVLGKYLTLVDDHAAGTNEAAAGFEFRPEWGTCSKINYPSYGFDEKKEPSVNEIKAVVLKALGGIGDPRAVKHVLAMLSGGDENVRFEAASALEKTGWKPSGDDDRISYVFAKRDFAELSKDPAGAAFIRGKFPSLTAAEKTSVCRSAAGEAALAYLEAAAADGHFQVRMEAATAAGKIKNGASAKILEKLSADGDRDVRWRARLALIDSGAARYEAYKKSLSDEDFVVRLRALARAETDCAKKRDRRLLEMACDMMNDADGAVSERARRLLERVLAKKFGRDVSAWKNFVGTLPE